MIWLENPWFDIPSHRFYRFVFNTELAVQHWRTIDLSTKSLSLSVREENKYEARCVEPTQKETPVTIIVLPSQPVKDVLGRWNVWHWTLCMRRQGLHPASDSLSRIDCFVNDRIGTRQGANCKSYGDNDCWMRDTILDYGSASQKIRTVRSILLHSVLKQSRRTKKSTRRTVEQVDLVCTVQVGRLTEECNSQADELVPATQSDAPSNSVNAWKEWGTSSQKIVQARASRTSNSKVQTELN